MTAIIKDYIEGELVADVPGPLGDDDNLLATGLVDSVGIMSLVLFLEDRFGIEVPPEDVTIQHFRSVGTIAAYVEAQGGAA